MPEIRTVTTLRRKRDEISSSIKLYERQAAQARQDLAHVAAAIRIFEASGRPSDIARYVDTYRLFKPREPWAIHTAELAKRLHATSQLALCLMQAKGSGTADAVLFAAFQ
jgi:hypothetical protein